MRHGLALGVVVPSAAGRFVGGGREVVDGARATYGRVGRHADGTEHVVIVLVRVQPQVVAQAAVVLHQHRVIET